MERISVEKAKYLIDFSGGNKSLESLSASQLAGTVALHNRLIDKKVAYLADEVGMGKTYIALGVVALMRRFNPSLRVLYLLPKNNVRDKWVKDYKSFIEQNYRHRDLSVKGLGDQPVASFLACNGLPDFVQSVATTSTRDFFICTSAFSFPMGNTVKELTDALDYFGKLLPQHEDLIAGFRNELRSGVSDVRRLSELKNNIKFAWADALNDILPRFDLVVVDEAHNLKKGRESSDRNQLLAKLLGSDNEKSKRIGRLLLLSATPFDRQLHHLRNQFELFGFSKNAALPDGNSCSAGKVQDALSSLIVRRLNSIDLEGKRHTRNMYRQEHRTGKVAEVIMSIEQQMFAALLQKKVSEYLKENCAGRFELGMLASFESYLPGEKNKIVEFDGHDDSDTSGSQRDARDKHIVDALIDDFNDEFKNTPPHPKMDWVAEKAHQFNFNDGKKQLIFVRRVRSVSELKFKLERAYDQEIGKYISNDSGVYYWFEKYTSQARDRNQSLQDLVDRADLDKELPATGDNFFTWFYRGKNSELEGETNRLHQTPFNFRNTLTQTSFMFEINWASLHGLPDPNSLSVDWARWVFSATDKVKPKNSTVTNQLRFKFAQYAYLNTVVLQGDEPQKKIAKLILDVAFVGFRPAVELVDFSVLSQELLQQTIWDKLREYPGLLEICPDWNAEIFKQLGQDERLADRCVRRLLIQHELLAVVCRIDHPFIDLYSLRESRKGGEAGGADSQLIVAFVSLLLEQKDLCVAFSSFTILSEISKNIDLLIKQNFAEAYQAPADKLTIYLTRQLSPLSPVSGATGENSSNRSPLARKFRMPGYPRVLVSTDVFQEGEDLHTFCDSVIHYGISASPIALEQKVGRVDRINSLAHRKMRAAGSQYQQHFIQVTYPHIRESVEFFQVRKAAANLNAFQRSLHNLGDAPTTHGAEIDERNELVCADEVEPQISVELKTKFEITDQDLSGDLSIDTLVAKQLAIDNRLSHVRLNVDECISEYFRNVACESHYLREFTEGWIWQTSKNEPVEVVVRSAKGLAELLISVSSDLSVPCVVDLSNKQERVDWLRTLQIDPLVRLQWRCVTF